MGEPDSNATRWFQLAAESGIKPILTLRSGLARYGLAIALVALAFVLRALLEPSLQHDSPFLLFVPAILAASGLGGFGPGFVATILSVALVSRFFASPTDIQADLINGAAFCIIGVGIAWFGESLRRAVLQAFDRNQDLLAREAHLQSILDTVPDAMIVIDGRARCNRSAARPNDCSAMVRTR